MEELSFRRVLTIARQRGRTAAGAVVLLILTWLIFFLPQMAGQTHFVNDIKKLYYPLEVAYAQAQQAGQLPLWNPYFGFGHPLLAWGQLGFFTPLHLLLRLFGIHPLAVLQLSVMLYHGLGAAGMYGWLRRYRLAPLAAAAGSLVYVFSGFHLGHLTHVNFYVATMVLPFLLWAIFDVIHRRSRMAVAGGALALGTMFVSGHMQMAVYAAGIAALYVLIEGIAARASPSWRAQHGRTISSYLLMMTALGGLLSAVTIAPLYEFWSQTDRATSLSHEELYEFSYPPVHAITLVAPFFFGDYSGYWGAKNFAELSGYTGLIPLLASGVALAARRPRRLVAFASLLAVISLSIGLGVHSPFYRFLVETQLLTSVAVPARLLLFFNTAIAILTSCGLHAFFTRRTQPLPRPWVAGAVALPLVLLLPFIWHVLHEPSWYTRVRTHLAGDDGWLIALTALTFILAWRAQPSPYRVAGHVLLLLAMAASLVVVGWQYNPVISARDAYAPAPFAETLQEYRQRTGVPARLFTRPQLMVAPAPVDRVVKRTDAISSTFTVHQPLTATADYLACVLLAVESEQRTGEAVRVSLYSAGGEQRLRQVQLSPQAIATGDHRLCFEPLPESSGQQYLLTFESTAPDSGLRLLYGEPAEDNQRASFIRVAHPTPEQLAGSRKQAQLILRHWYQPPYDTEITRLPAQLQVAAEASTAGWIGSLAHGRFRQFAQRRLAIDGDLVDSDGNHVLVNNRSLFDAAGISHLIQAVPFDHHDLLTRHNFTVSQEVVHGDGVVRLYENPQAVPKAYLASKAVGAATDADAERLLHQYRDDLPGTVIVHGSDSLPYPAPPGRAAGQAAVTAFDFSRITIAVAAEQPAILVLTELATPQWRVAVDGTDATLLVANTIWRAVAIPAGEHTVTFWYDSPATALGLRAGAAGLLGSALVAGAGVRRRLTSIAQL